MKSILRHMLAAGIAASFMIAVPAAAGAAEALTDAREMAPEGLIGMWKADIDASTFSGEKPRAIIPRQRTPCPPRG